jgi:hypothetical protein
MDNCVIEGTETKEIKKLVKVTQEKMKKKMAYLALFCE